MNENEVRVRNLVLALEYGLITWFEYFAAIRTEELDDGEN